MIFRHACTLTLVWLLIALLSGCDFYEQSRQKRDARAQANTGAIEIAVVWPQQLEAGLFMEGVQLAAAEINTTGVYANRPITLHIFDETSAEQGKRVAKQIAANPNIVAAIGHYGSNRSLPAAVTYEYNGILYMSPVATSPSLTRFGFNYLFRNIPTDAEISAAVLAYCQQQNWKNAAIVYVRSDYGLNFTEIIQEKAYQHDIAIATLKSYAENQDDFRAMIVEMRRHHYDFVFIADIVPRAAHFIRQYRAMGGTEPFISGEGLDSNLLWSIAGKAANSTIVATTFDATDNHPKVQGFVERFRARYPDKQPDYLAAQGYDALMVIANSMRQSQSSAPIQVASALRFSPPWEGVLGAYAMQLDGSIAGKNIVFKKMVDGAFHLQQGSEE